MQLELGQKIRELRHRDGRTQEMLADALGVTSQAISRWEANGGYPDMEIIPAIANYFGVSIDELFGYENDRERKVDAIIKRSEELHRVDWGEDVGIDECIELLRDGLIEFPGNERIMLRLVVVLRDAGFVRDGHHSLWDKDGFFTPDIERHRRNKYFLEAIKLLERMSNTSSGETLYDVRYEADRRRSVRNNARSPLFDKLQHCAHAGAGGSAQAGAAGDPGPARKHR